MTDRRIVDLSRLNRRTKIKQGIKGVQGDTGAVGPGVPVGGTDDQVLTKNSVTDFDTSWQDAGGGVTGEWELVTTETVVGAAVQEILFDTDVGGGSLDFTTYDYRISGIIHPTSIKDSDDYRWYATEASAAAVTESNYRSQRGRISSSFQDSQLFGNFIHLGVTSTDSVQIQELVFIRDEDGKTYLIGGNVVSTRMTISAAPLITVGTSSVEIINTNAPTHIGIYDKTSATMDDGTRLTLSRRLRS